MIKKPAGESAGKVVKNSAVISFINGLGSVSALLVDMIIAATYGLSETTDAFFIAFTIPRIITTVMMTSTNNVLIPRFSSLLADSSKDKVWYVGSNMTNLSLLGFTVLALIFSSVSPLLIPVFGAGLNVSSTQLAVSLSQIVFFMIVPAAGVEVLTSLLYSLRDFALPPASKLLFHGGAFLVVLLTNQLYGIYSLAFGYVAGALLQFAFLFVALSIRGFRYRPVLNWNDRHFRETMREIRWPIMGDMMNQGNLIVERFLASFLPAGVVSALVYARRMFSSVDAILLGSISTAFFPRFSTQFAQNRIDEFKRSILLSLRLTAFVTIPMTVLLILLSEPIIAVVFQRGAFDTETTQITAMLFSIYLFGFFPTAVRSVLISSHYAMLDTKTPFRIAVMAFIMSILLYVGLFLAVGAIGLAVTVPIIRVMVSVPLARSLIRRVGQLDYRLLLAFISKIAVASSGMGAVVYLLRDFNGLADVLPSAIDMPIRLVASTLLGVFTFGALLLFLRVPETLQVLSLFKARLRHDSGKLS